MRKILAIDDQIDNLITIKAVIKSRIPNCDVLTALSGKDGIDIAIKEQPDTILLDIIMPEMDGFETCKRLKENELTKHIPVLMITAIKTDSENRVKGLNMGADAFLSKPIDATELSAQVNVMLRIKKAEDKLRAEKEVLEETVLERTYKLKESEEKYKALYNNAPLSYQSLNEDGSIKDVNPTWLKATGYQREEVIGKWFGDFLHPDWKTIFEKSFPVFKKQGHVHDIHFKIRHKTGHYLDILFEGCIGYHPDGSFKQTYCVFQDITLRKLTDKALKKSEELNISITQSANDAIISINADGNILSWNNAAEKIFGYSSKEMINNKLSQIIPERYKTGHNYGIKRLKEGGKEKRIGETIEMAAVRKGGSEFPIELSLSSWETDSQKYFTGIIRDITERKRAEMKLQIERDKLTTIFESMVDGVYIVNKDYDIQYANPALKKDFGPYKGKKCYRYFHNSVEPCAFCKNEEVFAGKIVQWEWTSPINGKTYDLVDTPLVNTDGSISKLEIFRDITERKLSEQKLKKNEAHLQTLVETIPDLIWMKDPNGIYLSCNQRFEKLYGASMAEIRGKTDYDFVDKELADLFRQKDKEAIAAGKPTMNEEEVIYADDGHHEILETIKTPVFDSDGQILGVLGIARDITERKRAEQIQKVLYNISNAVIATNSLKNFIEKIKSELGTVIDTKNFYIAFYDSKTNTISSPFIADEKDSFKTFPAGKSLTYYVIKTQKSLLATKEKVKELEDSGDVKRFGTDSEVWLGVPLKVEGKVTGVFAVQSYTDENAYNESDMEMLEFIADQISISLERKKTEELLKKSKEQFDLAMKASKDGIYDWNLITNEVYYSANWKSILGYTDKELPNDISIWESLSHQEDKEKSLLKLKKAIEQKIDRYDVEFRMKHKLGHWVHILSRAEIIYNQEGEAIRAVGTHADLTEQKETEQILKEALNKAEESDRLKSAFLANMSHEIRTPMNGIMGFAQLLKEPNLESDDQLQFINIIENSGNRMLNIINDLIDISKIEAGQTEILISDVDINKQTEYLYTFFKPEAEKAGLKLSFKNTLANPLAIIKSDREKIYAILTNLIKNAIKYTNEGSIEFGYNLKSVSEAASSTSSPTQLEFFVKDTGIGIAQDKQEVIFERFIQADLSLSSQYEGAGLGLAITKAYVEILGGKIWVESVEGQGSQFYFTLPYHIKSDQATETDLKSNIATNPKKLNILIAEDDETSKIYLATMTKSICKKVMYAKTGIEAVETCKEKQDIDLILMDIKMPEMDGLEATQKIREFNKEVIIISQTAYALAGDREKALEAGCNDYISKPIQKEKLLEIVWKHIEK